MTFIVVIGQSNVNLLKGELLLLQILRHAKDEKKC